MFIKLNFEKNRDSGISQNVSQLLKGLACLVIVLHHYSQYVLRYHISDFFIYKIFSTSGGYLGVALFFFLSGYGLMESEQRHHLALKEFLIKRYWKIYKPVLIINIATIAIYWSIGFFNYKGLSDFLIKIFSITALDGILWYVKVLFIFYAIFYFISLTKKYKAIGIVLATIGYILICIIIDVQSWYYISVPAFTIGVLVSIYKNLVHKYLQMWKTWIIFIFVYIILIFIFYKTMDIFLPIHAINNIFFLSILLIFLANVSIIINRKSFLGKISYEIYLTHMKVFKICNINGKIINVWIYIPLVILVGTIFHYITNFEIINKKKTIQSQSNHNN
jgi:peptidoglycan/LPS O-acetylase OafA/YrhL